MCEDQRPLCKREAMNLSDEFIHGIQSLLLPVVIRSAVRQGVESLELPLLVAVAG
jgi:hypothetical protein